MSATSTGYTHSEVCEFDFIRCQGLTGLVPILEHMTFFKYWRQLFIGFSRPFENAHRTSGGCGSKPRLCEQHYPEFELLQLLIDFSLMPPKSFSDRSSTGQKALRSSVQFYRSCKAEDADPQLRRHESYHTSASEMKLRISKLRQRLWRKMHGSNL